MLIMVCLSAPLAWGNETVPPPAMERLCVISDPRITESSGIALSRRQSDAVWLHNDSGDAARLFLVGLDGHTRGVLRLSGMGRPLDSEDMCSFTANGAPWLLVGDVGDNSRNRCLAADEKKRSRACRLFLFPEPEMKGALEREAEVPTIIRFEFEDGPHNCESVAVDTERGEILLVTKSKPEPLDCGLYRIPLTLEKGTSAVTALRIADLKIAFATAMDISPDGRRMVILAPGDGAVCIDRRESESWGDAAKRTPHVIPLPERKNGETLCFGHSRDELLLNSEFVGQPLWSVKIPNPMQAPGSNRE